MIETIDIQHLWSAYGVIFLLMLSSFVLGYGLSTLFSKKKMKTAMKDQKEELESLHITQSIKDIDTIFTEIKPKIIDIVKETQEKSITATIITEPKKTVAEKAKSTYVSYSKKEVVLDLTNIGKGTPDMPDDLTKIEGIGPYVEERLNTIGVQNYEQISKLNVSDIRIITELIEFFPGRIERDNWVTQAKSLMIYRSKL